MSRDNDMHDDDMDTGAGGSDMEDDAEMESRPGGRGGSRKR